jgi:PAT family beta-lactamase induction signal transducer AmpG
LLRRPDRTTTLRILPSRAPTVADRRWRDLLILCLYGYQGLVAGFGLTAVPNWQAALGASTLEIGTHVALVGLPWTLQPLWGPVVDRFGGARMGRRRGWILLGLAGALGALALLPLAGEGPGAIRWIGPVLMLHSVCASLVDTAADALIIDRVPPGELGRATAFTRIGFATGTALGAGLFAWLIPHVGLGGAVPALLLLVALAAAVPLLVREEAQDALVSLRGGVARGAPAAFGTLFRALRDAMSQRASLALLLLGIVAEFAVGAFGVRLAVEMVQVGGWDAAALSRLQGLLALAGGTAGAVAVGWWADRTGPRIALVTMLGGCALAFAACAVLLAAWPLSATEAAAALSLSSIAPALFFVALAPVAMLGSRGAAAATRFALFMAALNLGSVLGAAASAPLGAMLALPQVALAGAVVFAGCALAAARPGFTAPAPREGAAKHSASSDG